MNVFSIVVAKVINFSFGGNYIEGSTWVVYKVCGQLNKLN